MAVTYNDILRELALSVNAITGATATLLETSYSTSPLTSANFQSSIFPFTGLKDKMLGGQEDVIDVVASTGDHPWRAFIETQTSNKTYGALVATNSSGVPVIGSWGDVRDAVTGQPCTKNELRQIQDRVINPGNMWLISVYWYARSDQRVYHTVDNVIIDVVAYQRPDSDTLDLTTAILLPDDAASAIINASLMRCIRDDEFMSQGAQFGARFDQWVSQVKSGYVSVNSTSEVVEKAA